MENYVYEVITRGYKIVGGTIVNENTERKDEHEFDRVFYTHLYEAKKHVKYYAEQMGVRTFNNDRMARRIDERHHNDWDSEIPEYDVHEIEIQRHELRGYFYIRSA